MGGKLTYVSRDHAGQCRKLSITRGLHPVEEASPIPMLGRDGMLWWGLDDGLHFLPSLSGGALGARDHSDSPKSRDCRGRRRWAGDVREIEGAGVVLGVRVLGIRVILGLGLQHGVADGAAGAAAARFGVDVGCGRQSRRGWVGPGIGVGLGVQVRACVGACVRASCWWSRVA